MKSHKSFWDKFFKDGKGKAVLWQNPNIPLIGWALFRVLSFFSDSQKHGFSLVADAFLFLWAYLEITQGVNYFRRTLGVIVITRVVMNFFRF